MQELNRQKATHLMQLGTLIYWGMRAGEDAAAEAVKRCAESVHQLDVQLAVLGRELRRLEAEGAISCPHCDKSVRDALFCPYCGTALRAQQTDAVTCRDCESPLLENARFCGYCGTSVQGG